MKKILEKALLKISRIIYKIAKTISVIRNLITPIEHKLVKNNKQKTDLEKRLDENLVEETFQNFKEHFKTSVLFSTIERIREYAITTAVKNDINKEYYYLEFGVYKGNSANFFSKYVNKLYAFDGFEGLREDWIGFPNHPSGILDLGKKIPKLNKNVEPVAGWVEDTLEDFLKKHNPKVNFVHLDMDLYSPSKFTLEKLKPYLVKGAIIIFDELYNYIGWEHGEYKALKEVFNDGEFEYKAFHIKDRKTVIQIK